MEGVVLIVIVATLVAGIGAASLKAHRRRHARTLARFAHELGLAQEQDPHLISGYVDDVFVRIHVAASPDSATSILSVSARIEPPLRMGLELEPKSTIDWIFQASPALPVVGREFDDEFYVSAFNHDQARELLDSPAGKALIVANHRGLEPTVTDNELTMRFLAPHAFDWELPDQAVSVEPMIRQATKIVRLLAEQRAKVPASVLDASVDRAWTDVAHAFGGRFSAEDAKLEVLQDDARLTVRYQHVGSGEWRTILDLELREPLPHELAVTDSAQHSLWERVAGEDIRLGDGEFDRAFIVRGRPREAVLSRLNANTRAELTALRQAAVSVSLNRERVRVVVLGAVSDEHELLQLVERTFALGKALSLDQRRRRGAYR